MLLVLLLCSGIEVSAQNVLSKQLWFGISPGYRINDNLAYDAKLRYKRDETNADWTAYLIENTFGVNLKKHLYLESGLGFGHEFGNVEFQRFKVYPYQALSLNWPSSKHMSFKQHFKVQERISFLNNDASTTFNMRFRYKFQGRFKFPDSKTFNNLSVPLYMEAYIPIGKNTEEVYSNRTQLGAGLSYSTNKRITLTANYLWDRSRTSTAKGLELSSSRLQFQFDYILF